MSTLLSIVAFIVAVISIALIVVGVKNRVNSCTTMGGTILSVSILMVLCYFLNWIIPLIIIFGLIGTIFTFMGTSKDEEENISNFGIIYCILGLLFYFISFYYWYKGGWYTSMGIALCSLISITFINVILCKKGYIPLFSIAVCVLISLATIYVWMFLKLNGILIITSGFAIGIIIQSIWRLIYRESWKPKIKKRSYVYHDSLFYLTLFKDFIVNNFIRCVSFFRLNLFINTLII